MTRTRAFANTLEFTMQDPTGGPNHGRRGDELELASSSGEFELHQLVDELNTLVRERSESLEAARTECHRIREESSARIANLVHELRSPLTTIVGLLDVLATTPLSADQQRLSERLQQGCASLDMLVTRLGAGEPTSTHAVPFSPRDVIESVADFMSLRAEQKKLELCCDLATDLPPIVNGDPNQLRQVLLNLLGNAVKFTDQGEIVVHARVVHRETKAFLECSVADTGVGIAPADQVRIFRRFERGATNRPGSGLGLSIVTEAVESLGGSIRVESRLNCGSTFTFELPVLVDPPARAQAPRGGSRTFLVFTNRTCVSSAIRAMLRARGEDARCFATWAAGSAARSEPHDGIVLDAQLSDLADAAHDTSDRPRGIPVVLLTRVSAPDLEWMRPLRAATCITKPVRLEPLYDALQRILERPQTRQAARAATPTPRFLAPPPVSRAPGPLPTTHRALLVDDDPNNRAILRRAMERAGLLVDVAEDAASALERVRGYRYDLLVTDYHMPGIDGVSFMGAVRETERRGDRAPSPIIMVTADARAEVDSLALGAGAQAIARKPISLVEMERLARRWSDRTPVVVIADDSSDHRDLVENHLRAFPGLRIVHARDGSEALFAVASQRVSLLCLDSNMPNLDGVAVTAALRSKPSGLGVPILAMTGYDDPARIRALIEAGCTDILQKPIRRAALLERVERLLSLAPASGTGDPASTSAPGLPSLPDAAAGDEVIVDPDLADLVPAFLANRRKDSETLLSALQMGDLRKVQQLGHMMKGSGGGYGFPRISQLGATLEHAGSTGDSALAGETTKQLREYLAKVVIRTR